MRHEIEGVNVAAATPVGADGRPDHRLFTAHLARLLDEGAHRLAILGTTGEANSFSVAERQGLVDAALAAGIAGDRLLPGTSACNLPDTIALTRHAVAAGAKGCVMLPPFYYKGVSDEGLFRFYAGAIEGVGDARLRVILYHIPQVSQVPISLDLIGRLMETFPGIVVGIKDSSGNPDALRAMVDRFPRLGVLAGADPLLLPLLRMGGAGSITATSNLRVADLRMLWERWADPAAAAEVAGVQARVEAWRALSSTYGLLPTVKAMLARSRGDMGWLRTRPPLLPLDAADCAAIWAGMDRLGG